MQGSAQPGGRSTAGAADGLGGAAAAAAALWSDCAGRIRRATALREGTGCNWFKR